MKKLSILLIFILLLTSLTGCLTARPAASDTTEAPIDESKVHPMLFHVTGPNGQEGWLFGTIHVGDARTEVALNKLAPTLDACDALAVEFDVVAYEKKLMKDTEAQLAYYGTFALTDGTTVDQHMPAELYEKASALLGEAGLYPSLMKAYNLGMWSQLVEQAALMTRTSYDLEIGMDRSLIQHCYDKGIEVRDVEDPDFQTGLLAGFSDELNLLMIRSTLDNLDQYARNIDTLYDAWLAGSYSRLLLLLSGLGVGDEDYSEEELALVEEYNDKMLNQRNLGMRDKAVSWLEAGDKVFFAVGAAHLVGENGLVMLLRAAGYTVEQVSY